MTPPHIDGGARGVNPRAKLIEIETLLHEAIKNSELAKVTFPHLITAREDALEANAPQYAFETYEQAEKEFSDAAKTVEKGDVKKVDISNREKFLIDSVFNALEIDDKNIFEHTMKKIQDDEEFALIEIIAMGGSK